MNSNLSHPTQPNQKPSYPFKDGKPTESITEIEVIRPLCQSKFSIYLIESTTAQKYYAMKVFPYEGSNPSRSYLKEKSMMDLEHPNLIKIHKAKDTQKTNKDSKTIKTSLLIVELSQYGDFCELIDNTNFSGDERLVRTYFHQLIEGIKFLHEKNIQHLDIKTDNILLGEDFRLKICDFEYCHRPEDTTILGRGSPHYRAPELLSGTPSNFQALDIYSAGIVLFQMMFNVFPYLEDTEKEVVTFSKFVKNGDFNSFWEGHKALQNLNFNFSDDFKDLFEKMINPDPEKRCTIEDIQKHEWYNQPIYSYKELQTLMKRVLSKKPEVKTRKKSVSESDL